jgi:hypothetical protein
MDLLRRWDQPKRVQAFQSEIERLVEVTPSLKTRPVIRWNSHLRVFRIFWGRGVRLIIGNPIVNTKASVGAVERCLLRIPVGPSVLKDDRSF